MSDNITLHPELGVNPRMTICQRCGGDNQELMLLGHRNFKAICSCGMVHFGYTKAGPKECGSCGRKCSFTMIELERNERLPSPGVCKDCEQELENFAEEIKKGGIYFKCAACTTTGVIKGHVPLAKHVKEQAIKAGAVKSMADAIGIEFENCEQHTVQEEGENENNEKE